MTSNWALFNNLSINLGYYRFYSELPFFPLLLFFLHFFELCSLSLQNYFLQLLLFFL
uniref:Uncharacterized protein n=1 Tax=Rhizophora mucronata TaxID=61149 RepID=A0A2P2P026_RHIMU